MVSRRNFFSICIMMATILALFQASLLIRGLGTVYDMNEHLPSTDLGPSTAWTAEKAAVPAETVIYVGNSRTAQAGIVRQWAEYSKRKVVVYSSVNECPRRIGDDTALVCVAGSEIRATDAEALAAMVNGGTPMVFCDLPSPAVLRSSPALRNLLGIQEVVSDSVELTGIRLFEGFLLGGEVIYKASSEKEQELQDLELSAPWYLARRGTESFMVGLLEDSSVENEDLPGLIWINFHQGTGVLAVNGSYMSDQTGLGILSAAIYQLRDYDLHPVVNAQNLSVVDFPDFATENGDTLDRIYNRDMRRFQMDLMWPGLISAASKNGWMMTCFLSPRLDYESWNEQLPGDIDFYLKEFGEQGVEAGLTLDTVSGTDPASKMADDVAFFEASGSGYEYGAIYIPGNGIDAPERPEDGPYSSIGTIVSVPEAEDPILSYRWDGLLEQSVTANGMEHPYSQDLRARSIETAIAYCNVLLDMKNVLWPEEDTPQWGLIHEAFSSNIDSYWRPFSAFEKTTVSESSGRIRNFLALDYRDSREGDVITVDLSGRAGDVWFLLRTHSETVSRVEGGSFVQIEDGAYLIQARKDHLEITVERKSRPWFTLS